jgi:alkylation response protein AidB-like acyl-CoA dehydrogenase
VLESARQLAPLVREHAAETEAARELPKPVFNALADAGFYLMCVPRAVGGLEIDFPTYIQVLEELGKADASTAWTVSQGANWATYSARLPRDAARHIWDRHAAQRGIEHAGSHREGRGRAGRLSRHRPPALQHRHHARLVGGRSTRKSSRNGEVRLRDGKPEARYCLIPKSQAEVIDAWHTRGMRGTGTQTFEVKDVFVPIERTVFPYGAPLVSPGPRYRFRSRWDSGPVTAWWPWASRETA